MDPIKKENGSPCPEKADSRYDTHDHDVVEFGDSYRKLGKWRTALIFITNQVGIGILSLPRSLQVLGMIPGIMAIIGFGILATYTAYILVQFYQRYPTILNIVDAGRIIGGKWLEVIVGVSFVVNLALTTASANVTMSIAFNTITNNAICTVGFIGIPMIVCWLLCMPRSMEFMVWVGIPCTITVSAAVLIVMIALGVAGPNTSQPGYYQEPPNQEIAISLWGNPTFQEAFEALLNIAFAYAGNQAFVTVMAEMRDPSKDFTPAIIILQAFGLTLYVIVAAVIYALAGEYTRSPALGSATIIPAQVAYGFMFPTLFGSGLVFGHTAIKYMYVEVMRHMFKSKYRLTDTNVVTWSVWIGLGTGFWIISFILANAIPLFSSILGISSALFVSWFTFGMASIMWINLNWGNQFITWKKTWLTILNWLIVLVTCFLTVAGLWSSIDLMLAVYDDPNSDIDGSFTCADNSLF